MLYIISWQSSNTTAQCMLYVYCYRRGVVWATKGLSIRVDIVLYTHHFTEASRLSPSSSSSSSSSTAVIITIIMIIITILFSQVAVVMAAMRWYTRIILQCRAVWWVAFSLPVPVCVRRVPKYTAPTPHATRARADSTGRQTRFGTTPSLLSSHHRDTDFTLACSGAARANFQKKKNCWENPKNNNTILYNIL